MRKKKSPKESFESFVSRPRKLCEEMAPELARLPEKEREKQRLFRRLQEMMIRARVASVEDKLTKINDLDGSEKIKYHGEVSKRLYKEIRDRRDFDLYARPMLLKHENSESQQKLLAAALGVEYKKTENITELEKVKVPSLYENDPLKIQPLTTPAWNVGQVEVAPAPVGFASAPAPLPHSLGNEMYYSYNGAWKDGMMHGGGKYLYADGSTYEGGYRFNRQDGRGLALYPCGTKYEGFWAGGKADGQGCAAYTGGAQYEGAWRAGKRHGSGRISLPCGLVYEGDWAEGVPHGRGTMTSRLTGYCYIGSFHKGSILGGGTLITPPPESKKHLRYWNQFRPGFLLPHVVREFLEERESAYKADHDRREALYRGYRSRVLAGYVSALRTELHEGRARTKQEAIDERTRKSREEHEKIIEARLKLLEESNAKFEADRAAKPAAV